MNRRRHQRLKVQNLVADVSDGLSSCSGTVCDVSRRGVRINCVPHNLKNQDGKLSIVISIDDILNFKKMRGVPRWVNRDDARKKMGIQITDASSSWTVFVKNLERQGFVAYDDDHA